LRRAAPTWWALSFAVSKAALTVAVSFFVPIASPQKNSLFCTGYYKKREKSVTNNNLFGERKDKI
jgi:hypothetical protein